MKNKIIGIIFALIIVAGIAITCVWGLNFGLMYSNHKQVDIYIGQEFENQDIYEIVKEVAKNEKTIVQKVELYEDMVSITIKDINEEQLANLNTKINEKYGIENKVEDIAVTSIPNVRGRDLIKPYILPITISFVIIVVYLAVYNAIYAHMGRKTNTVKDIAKTMGTVVGIELLYLAVLAITRLEINRLTIPFAIVLYVVATIAIFAKLEKKNSKIEK